MEDDANVSCSAILFGFFTIFLWARVLLVLSHYAPLLGSWFSILCVTLYLVLGLYNFRTNGPLSFAVLRDHYQEVFRFEGLSVIFDRFEKTDLVMIGITYIGLLYLEHAKAFLSKTASMERPQMKLGICFVLYLAAIATGLPTTDQFTLLLRSAYKHLYELPRRLALLDTKDYPYINHVEPNELEFERAPKLPNVFVLIVESLKACVVERA